MKKRYFLSIILALILVFSCISVGCSTDSITGLVGDSSNYSQDSKFSEGIATSLESLNRNPIGTENLDRPDGQNTILTQNRYSVVEIYSILSNGSAGGASGVIVGYNAYSEPDLDNNIGVALVLTCHHVIENAVYVNVRDLNGNIYPAGLIGSNPGGDTALLWVKVKETPSVAKIASSSGLQVGETVFAIGNPTSMLGGTVTKGVISALSRDILINNQYINLLQIDAAINGGSSGGGLFTEDGYLVAMTNSGYPDNDGIGFAVPSDSFSSDINNFILTYKDDVYNTYGYIPGVASVGVSISLYDTGLIVSLTDTGSWKNSGVQVGDKVVSVEINGQLYSYVSASDLFLYISEQNLTVGDTYILNVVRDNVATAITITVKQLIYYPPTIQQNSSQSSQSESSSQSSTSQVSSSIESIFSEQSSVQLGQGSSSAQSEASLDPYLTQTELDQVLTLYMYFGDSLQNYLLHQIPVYNLVRQDDSNSPLTKNRKSVVEVYTITNNSKGAGSGVFIGFSEFDTPDQDGNLGVAYIVTNFHVIENAVYVNVKDMFGEKLYPAGLVGGDEYADIAVLYTKLDYIPSVAKFCDSSDVLVGDTVYAIGNPRGILGGSVSKGIVSALQRINIMDGFAMELLQVDSALNNGSSGGGIFTEEGYLVAIANSGYPEYDGLGFAIPSNNALKAINSILETYQDDIYNSYGYVKGSVNLGVSINNYGSNYWQDGINAGNQAVYISSIKENGDFYRAGIKYRDLIYSISYKGNNIEIKDASDLLVALYNAKLQVGETLQVVVYRNNELITIDVNLTQYVYCPPTQTT